MTVITHSGRANLCIQNLKSQFYHFNKFNYFIYNAIIVLGFFVKNDYMIKKNCSYFIEVVEKEMDWEFHCNRR